MTAALAWLGFLLGLRHALEPDHLAAVAALASRGARPRDVARVAAAWGFGHAAVLLVAGTALAWTGARWPPAVADGLAAAAGAMLVWLGAAALRRPAGAAPPTANAFVGRALLVGGVHGIEGSGAVVLLALPGLRSTGAAAGWLAAFGAGSIGGMLACSLAVTLPLGIAARRLAGAAPLVQRAVGAATVAVGALLILHALHLHVADQVG